LKELYIYPSDGYYNLNKKIGDLIEASGGLKIKSGDKVLLKPNLIAGKPIAITHPLFVRAVAEIIEDYGGKVEIADSPGSGEDIDSFISAGYGGFSYPFYKFDDFGVININGFPITEKINEYDFIINLPKLKTHLLTVLTLGVKNLFGFIPGRPKKNYHIEYPDGYSFSEMLFSLYRSVKTDVTILDGIVGMEGDGPTNGTKVKIGIIALARDPMVIDYGISEIFKIENFPLRNIYEEHFGKMDIDIIGDIPDIPEIKLPSSRISRMPRIGKIRRLLIHKKPIPIRKNCTLCRSCEVNCPTKAISIEYGNIYINYKRCIECYTCLEVCAFNALKVKKFIGFRVR